MSESSGVLPVGLDQDCWSAAPVGALNAGACEHSGFGLIEASNADQAFEFRAGAFDVLGHQRQVQREAQIVGA
ncbi:hypothetical protein [Streptomyces yatensis]|uniref:Uncharacterized protein n=1 Tax=Streptomyces yatensis TaxID=155177 RepID=A0ABP4UT89_9ACTN|nr:hypothetical protein [Streptomyces yatensis]